MHFVVIITAILGLALVVILVRQRFYADKPAAPPEEPEDVDIAGNPISPALHQETHDPNETTIPIYKLSNIAEAETLKALLEENGIDCMVHSFYDFAYDGLWQSQKGWGVLKVLAKDTAKAEDLIDAFLKAKDQPGNPASDEMMQETPIPADKPVLPRIIYTSSFIVLMGIGVFMLITLFLAYRASGRKLADEGYDYYLNGEYDKAIEYYNKAISHWYKKVSVYHDRGLAKAHKGDYDGAIRDYTRAIELEPNRIEAYINRGNARDKKGDHDGAIADYTKAIAIKPDDALAYYNRGGAYSHKGEFDKAIADYNKAVEIKPDYAYAYVNRGVVKKNKNDYDGAIKDYTRGIEMDSEDVMAYKNRGIARFNLNDFAGAIKDYTRAIELKPDDTDSYTRRGVAKLNKGDLKGAISDWEKAIQINPSKENELTPYIEKAKQQTKEKK